MSGGSGSKEPAQPPRTFQGWQRRGCLAGFGLIVLLALFLTVNALLGVLGIH